MVDSVVAPKEGVSGRPSRWGTEVSDDDDDCDCGSCIPKWSLARSDDFGSAACVPVEDVGTLCLNALQWCCWKEDFGYCSHFRNRAKNSFPTTVADDAESCKGVGSGLFVGLLMVLDKDDGSTIS